MNQTMELVLCYHSFRTGWKNLLRLQVEHCLSPKGTIASLGVSFWPLSSLLSNTGITCKVHDSAFELIMHAPLRSILKAKDPEGQLARWIEFLSNFDFEIQFRPEHATTPECRCTFLSTV